MPLTHEEHAYLFSHYDKIYKMLNKTLTSIDELLTKFKTLPNYKSLSSYKEARDKWYSIHEIRSKYTDLISGMTTKGSDMDLMKKQFVKIHKELLLTLGYRTEQYFPTLEQFEDTIEEQLEITTQQRILAKTTKRPDDTVIAAQEAFTRLNKARLEAEEAQRQLHIKQLAEQKKQAELLKAIQQQEERLAAERRQRISRLQPLKPLKQSSDEENSSSEMTPEKLTPIKQHFDTKTTETLSEPKQTLLLTNEQVKIAADYFISHYNENKISRKQRLITPYGQSIHLPHSVIKDEDGNIYAISRSTGTVYNVEEEEKEGFLGNGAFGRVKLVQHLGKLNNGVFTPTKPTIEIAKIIPNTEISDWSQEQDIQATIGRPIKNMTRQSASTKKNYTKGKRYFISKYIAGTTLSKYTADRRKTQDLSTIEKLEILLQILVETKKLHDKRIVHRDIKGDNILINPKTKKLYHIDFGLAKQFEQKDYTEFVQQSHYDIERIERLLNPHDFMGYDLEVPSNEPIFAMLRTEILKPQFTPTANIERCISMITNYLYHPIQRGGYRS